MEEIGGLELGRLIKQGAWPRRGVETPRAEAIDNEDVQLALNSIDSSSPRPSSRQQTGRCAATELLVWRINRIGIANNEERHYSHVTDPVKQAFELACIQQATDCVEREGYGWRPREEAARFRHACP